MASFDQIMGTVNLRPLRWVPLFFGICCGQILAVNQDTALLALLCTLNLLHSKVLLAVHTLLTTFFDPAFFETIADIVSVCANLVTASAYTFAA